uniref:Uncharacterized protein n=1 Tax=Plectus sambesii TaxID=2011161 RepID=A0A914UNR1_9BILA
MEARLAAQRLHFDEMNAGYAWGAMALRSDARVEGNVSWLLPSQPRAWHCSGKTRNGWIVLIFRTGARYIPSTHDHWWWYSLHQQDTCPLSIMRAYFSQVDVKESVKPNDFLRAIMHIVHGTYSGQWAGVAVTRSGRSLLGKALDLSVPPYLMNSQLAWCQMTTTSGWFVNVFQLEYSSDNLEL